MKAWVDEEILQTASDLVRGGRTVNELFGLAVYTAMQKSNSRALVHLIRYRPRQDPYQYINAIVTRRYPEAR